MAIAETCRTGGVCSFSASFNRAAGEGVRGSPVRDARDLKRALVLAVRTAPGQREVGRRQGALRELDVSRRGVRVGAAVRLGELFADDFVEHFRPRLGTLAEGGSELRARRAGVGLTVAELDHVGKR